MRPRTDDEILEDLKDWPVRNIYVERGVKLIEQLRQRVTELEMDRDKAAQYWQIAEGRCDALMKQRDALVEAATMAIEMIEYDKHERRHVRWKLLDAIASVKEK